MTRWNFSEYIFSFPFVLLHVVTSLVKSSTLFKIISPSPWLSHPKALDFYSLVFLLLAN